MWDFYGKHLVSIFYEYDTHCLLVEGFRPFTLNVTIKMNGFKSTNGYYFLFVSSDSVTFLPFLLFFYGS